ncbi:MAG: aminotransferase class I/II-fold pyridoxal phosphate-dependent enzyme [Rikenellaceae bacterium]|nr:aminotransferase class I/II-fold pyridoxal phosphate-dependent enzyme [Rikenellaceae bacterium]MBQ3255295.1 aminotransferase class I/II-fold pyridoxal phosphate-dependent enzyme [Rikenellaceae bacterium]
MKEPINIQLSDRLEGVGEYYFSRKLREIDQMRAAGRRIISLGIGSPDRPPHSSVVDRLHEVASRPDTHAYQSYKGAAVLRRAFSAWYADRYGVQLDPESEILPLIGSKEGLMHICMTYLRKGDRVLIPNPGYPTYRSAVTLSGGEPKEYRLNAEGDWFPNFDEIEREGLEGVKMMILNYPQMPTGAVPTREMFARVVEFAHRHSILLVHDNPYSFVRNAEPLSLLSVEGAKECAIELNSLSKSHNMAGWRIGMIGGRKEWIDQIMRFKSNMDSGQFLPMQEAAATALALGDEWYAELNEEYYAREAYGYRLLDALGCSYRKGQAGLFIWAELPAEFEGDCYAFSDRVLERCGVFVTPGGIFGSEGNRYIRISLCAKREQLAEAIEAIEKNF